MLEKGISPPPRPDMGLAGLARAGLQIFTDYILELDRWFRRLQAAVPKIETYSVSLDVASVGANSTSEQTFAVPGLSPQDIVLINKPSHTSGLAIVNCRVSAANELAITFANITGSPIDPSAETYLIVSIRR